MNPEQRTEWEREKQRIQESISQMNIPADPNTGILKKLLSDIDSLYTSVRLEYADLKYKKERIEKMIYAVEKKGALNGSNDTSRRANGVIAVENFRTEDGRVINLWDSLFDVAEKYEFLAGVISTLESKQSKIVTENGILKLERGIL